MNTRIRPVILCGGAGTRLWPTSRSSLPKQFAPLLGGRSTFQETLIRVRDAEIFGLPIIVTSVAHRYLAEQQLAEIDMLADIVLEPLRRDSGPAILAACLVVARNRGDAPLLVLAADHVVQDQPAFQEAVLRGLVAASAGFLVTFGITPTRPETEYGYIEPAGPAAGEASRVRRFAEKPNAEAALRYVATGHLWNSGNFLFSARSLIAEYTLFAPQTVTAVTEAVALSRTQSSAGVTVVTLDEKAFSRAEKRSIDYAVLEHTARAAVVQTSCGWSDIGSWDVMWGRGDHDDRGNVIDGDVELFDSHNCFVSTDRTLTSLLGVEGLVVIANRDAILIADRHRSAEVKGVVETLRGKGRPEADTHARVHRPWGWYEVIDSGDQFQVKRIVVHPNGRLSLQKHRHRAEHWVIVSGIAKVTIDGMSSLLGCNEHAYVPLGSVHRLENPGSSSVELIEVQSGTYLGEDDIVRLEDIYDRV